MINIKGNKVMTKQKISVVIPCYNSEHMIETVINDILETIVMRPEYDYEIILVNDGSADNTWVKISDLALHNENIMAINFSKNFGQHSAILAGYRHVTGDIILNLDDDGEYNPKEMYQLIDKLQEGYDYVCAKYETNQSRFRSFGTRINNWMATWMINKPKNIDLTSFCVMRRFVVDEIIRYQQPYPYIAGLLLRATQNLGTVPLVRKKRLSGQSGYNLKRLFGLWFNGFTAFSIKPLRFATGLGIITAIISFISAIVLLIKRLFFVEYISGWASIIICISFFSGIIMILLGIIGEYVGRIYISINNAPQYVIKETVQKDKKRNLSE